MCLRNTGNPLEDYAVSQPTGPINTAQHRCIGKLKFQRRLFRLKFVTAAVRTAGGSQFVPHSLSFE